jgi:hypothetical protein
MAWRKVWKQRRKGTRRVTWVLRWYDDSGTMRAKAVNGDAKTADEECRRLEHKLNDGDLGRRHDIDWLTFCETFLRELPSRTRPRIVDDYREALEQLTEFAWPQRISQVLPSVLRDFVSTRTDGRSPATRNKLIR